jgi:superfamily II DNA or RNA helicase
MMDEKTITMYNTHTEVTPYEKGECEQLENYLSKRVYVSKYNHSYKIQPLCYYIEDGILYLPRGITSTELQRYFHTRTQLSVDHDPRSTFRNGRALEPAKSRIQQNGMDFLCQQGDYAYAARYNQLGLNLATGDGKTYSAIYAILYHKMRTVIITDKEKIKLQWMNEFLNKTTVKEDQLLNVSGSEIVDAVINGKIKADIYFVNHQTICSYARANGWKSVHKFFNAMKVGIKVIDEAHEFFESIFMIDCFTNTFKTFYLTATFGRSDTQETRVYKRAFSSLARFGEETINFKEKRRHTVFVVCYFSSKPPYDIPPNVKTNYGFSSHKYIDYELNVEENHSLLKVVYTILNSTKQLQGKTLILSPKIESVEFIRQRVSYHCNEVVGSVHSKNSKEMNVAGLDQRIISSTIKSVGTGVDIPELRMIINLEPISSKVLAEQVRGRLREYSPDKDTFLFYPVDTSLPESLESLKRIMPVMKKQCKAIKEIHIDV